MLRNRLASLLADRGIKISRAATELPNLSRNTITNTASNTGKMIQLEIINALCQYLGVTPNEFFEYLPFDVDISINSDNELIINEPDEEVFIGTIRPFYLNLYIRKKSTNQASGITSKTFELSIISEKPININADDNRNLVPSTGIGLTVMLGNPPEKANYEKQKEEFDKFWNDELTPGFQQDIRSQIISETSKYMVNEIQNKLPSVDWHDFKGVVNFRFDKYFDNSSDLTAGPVVDFQGLELPF